MALFFKKVDAVQFNLTEEEKENVRNRKAVFFEGSPVKHVGGTSYLALMQRGENLIKIYNGQWLVRHPDGMLQVCQDQDFKRDYKSSDKINQPAL